MKHLILLILLAVSTSAHSQDRSSVDSADYRQKRNTGTQYLSSDPNDHRRVHENDIINDHFRTSHRSKGAIGVIVGAGIMATGVTIMLTANGSSSQTLNGYFMTCGGAMVFLVSAPIFIVNMTRNRNHRYSIFVSDRKAGLAFNF